jgi:quercetin dioxygenase-like cupin family protein
MMETMEKERLISADLNSIDLNEFIGKEDPRQHCKATFPLIGLHGSKDLATVYFEIAPGDNLGMHTDSAEELLVVLKGEGLATVGRQQATVAEGGIVLVPKLVPHDIINIGVGPLKVLGVFGGANNIVAKFEKEWLPTNSNMIDTSQL